MRNNYLKIKNHLAKREICNIMLELNSMANNEQFKPINAASEALIMSFAFRHLTGMSLQQFLIAKYDDDFFSLVHGEFPD